MFRAYDTVRLRVGSKQEQMRLMEAWFRERFEDPAQRTFYDSAEGGYVWMGRGPHDAREELVGEFQGVVPDDIIEELVDKLQSECFEWARADDPDDYDPELFAAIRQNRRAQQTLEEALVAIEALLRLNVPGSRNQYVGVGNVPMVNDPTHSTVVQLSRTAVAGKPYTVSETNHPFPNEYASEGIPILAAYAGLQDWDMVVMYTFEPKKDPAWKPYVGDPFDISHDPVRMTEMAAGALIFLRGDVKAA
jgi:hypothetical protein